jgi:hypothetical protein
MSRLDDPATAAVVLVMQRVHEDDLAGHLLEKGGWSLLRLPAIAAEAEEVALGRGRVHRRAPGELLEPGRLAMPELEEARRHLGAQLFEAQYQQDPVPAGGALIRAEWLAATYAGPPVTGPDEAPKSVAHAPLPGGPPCRSRAPRTLGCIASAVISSDPSAPGTRGSSGCSSSAGMAPMPQQMPCARASAAAGQPWAHRVAGQPSRVDDPLRRAGRGPRRGRGSPTG